MSVLNNIKQPRGWHDTSCEVVLLETYELALFYSRYLSSKSSPQLSIGTTVSTFNLWARGLWDLYGDGRKIVSSVQREMLLRCVCDNLVFVQVANDCLQTACGLDSFEEALAAVLDGSRAYASISAEEHQLLCSIVAYKHALDDHGLVEFGDGLRILARQILGPCVNVAFIQDAPLTLQQEQFFRNCPAFNLQEVQPLHATFTRPRKLGSKTKPYFAFPSGNYAWPALLADNIKKDERSAVVCKSPLSTYEALLPAMNARGLSCVAAGRMPFNNTALGRAMCGLHAFLDGLEDPPQGFRHVSSIENWERANLADYLLSEFSGFDTQTAFAMDARMRADRAFSRVKAAEQLRAQSTRFELFEELLSDPAASLLCGSVEDIVNQCTWQSDAWRSEQLSALRLLREAMNAACACGLGMSDVFDVLQSQSIKVMRSNVSEVNQPDVTILDQASAANCTSMSFDSVFLCDLASDNYPAARPSSAADTLLAKFGIAPVETTFACQLRHFGAIEEMALKRFVLERPLNDESGDPTCAAAVVEEFVDLYRNREDLSSAYDIDNAYGLPKSLQANLLLRGEGALYENACLCDGPQPQSAHITLPATGVVGKDARSLVVLPRVIGKQVFKTPSLSPSQIENYLECPYKWFANRRLRLEEIDEAFGPMETGNFAHHALESFYRHFREDLGLIKVTSENLPQAKALMQEILDRHELLQATYEPGERLLPVTQLEVRELGQLKAKLLRYLDFEAELLPSFHPEYLEFDIAKGSAADYAGVKLVGTADRVDVDDHGNFAVIDYKGSLSSDFDLSIRSDTYLGKVQALIYAQVLRRTLSLNPVAAVYVCYGRKHEVHGAYDGTLLDAKWLPGVNPDKSRFLGAPGEEAGAFTDLLDRTEERISEALEKLVAGNIDPVPAHKDACKYCPVSSCTERMA